jgi:outer membrane lipoprotein-sorting protein
MKNLLLCIAFFSFLSLNSLAQTQVNTDQGATKIMDEVIAKYNTFSNMTIDFTFKSEKNKAVLYTSKGKLIIKGEKYHATFDNQIFACDSILVWNYQKEGNEVSLFEFDENDKPIFHPTKFIANWKNEFTAKFIREEFKNNKTLVIIDLTPKKGASYYKIRIFIDKSKNEITQTQIFEKDNTIYSYIITSMITNSTVSDQIFKFNKTNFPNVQINDMR